MPKSGLNPGSRALALQIASQLPTNLPEAMAVLALAASVVQFMAGVEVPADLREISRP